MSNVVNIQITVDDDQLSQLLKNNISDLPQEKVQEILCEALSKFLESSDGQKLFYTKEYYNSTPRPTDLLLRMMQNAIASDAMKLYWSELLDSMKEKYPELIKEAMITTFSNMFFTELQSSVLHTQLNNIIAQVERKVDK